LVPQVPVLCRKSVHTSILHDYSETTVVNHPGVGQINGGELKGGSEIDAMAMQGTGDVYIDTRLNAMSRHLPKSMDREMPQQRALRHGHERHTIIRAGSGPDGGKLEYVLIHYAARRFAARP